MTEITCVSERAERPRQGSPGDVRAPGRAIGRAKFVEDPGVRLLGARRERDARLPAEALEDHRVVGVPPTNALRRIEVIAAIQADAGDLLDDAHELVDCHELRRTEVDRI